MTLADNVYLVNKRRKRTKTLTLPANKKSLNANVVFLQFFNYFVERKMRYECLTNDILRHSSYKKRRKTEAPWLQSVCGFIQHHNASSKVPNHG